MNPLYGLDHCKEGQNFSDWGSESICGSTLCMATIHKNTLQCIKRALRDCIDCSGHQKL